MDNREEKWQGRPVVAGVLRVFVTVAPIAISIVLVTLLGRSIPRPDGWLKSVGWWLAMSGIATMALVAMDKLFRRLLPVVALFRLSLVFPDKAPSRFNAALRTGTVRQLKRRMDSGEFSTVAPQEAAEQLVGLASALNAHDRLTRGHTERVRAYSGMIGQELGLDEDELEFLNWSGLVHDIGKLAVPTEILNKPGKPSEEEWKVLRDHPAKADALVEPLRPWLGEWAESATQHHERFDGEGYPYGISGRDITLAGRIVAVADAYDVMTSTRSYKKAMPAAEARQQLAVNAGSQFDPEIVRAFLGVSMGRLRLVAGPLGSLVQLPAGSASLGSAAATGAGAVTTVAIAVFTGLVSPPVDAVSPSPIPEAVAMTIESRDLEVIGREDAVLLADLGVLIALPGTEIQIRDVPDEGLVEVSADGLVSFIPDENFNGTVNVRYDACLEDGVCADGTITFVVAAVNDAPIASNDTVTLAEDTLAITHVLANDFDVDGDPLHLVSIRVIEDAERVIDSVELNADHSYVTIEGHPNAWGSVLLEYTTADPTGATATAAILVEITAVNDAPEAFDDSGTVVENTRQTLDVLANDVDVDGDDLRIRAITEVVGGSATTDGTSIVFTPSPRYVGPASLIYAIEDDSGVTSSARLVLDVQDDPSRPSLAADHVSTFEDQSVVVDVLANDPSPAAPLDTTTLVVWRQASNGTASVGPGRVFYTPNSNWSGVDTFEYFACDVGNFCGTSSVSITVTAVNDAPSFMSGDNVVIAEDAPGQLVSNWATGLAAGPADEASQSLSFTTSVSDPGLFATQPAVSPTGDLSFTPAPNAAGSSTVTITIKDSGGTANGGVNTSVPVASTITVGAINDAPQFLAGPNMIVPEDSGPRLFAGWASSIVAGPANEAAQSLSFLVTPSDPSLFSSQPAVSPTGDLSFSSAADANGSTTVAITLSDSGGTAGPGIDTSPPIITTITVDPVNDAPQFTTGVDVAVAEDGGAQTVTGWATAISTGPPDEAAQTAAFSVIASDPALFSVQPGITPAGDLSFTPAPNLTGSVVLTIELVDDGGTLAGGVDTSAPGTATVTVTATNDAPTATDDNGAGFTTLEDTLFTTSNVTLNDTDIDDPVNPASVAIVTPPATGTLTNNGDGTFNYDPTPNFFGSVSFTYTVTDPGLVTSNAAIVTITVGADNDAPNALDDNGAGFSTLEDTLLTTADVTANDSDIDDVIDPTTTSVVSGPASGTLTNNGDGTFDYDPAPNFFGSTTFTYTITDPGLLTSNTATVTITVTATNDAPTATDDNGAGFTTLEDTLFTTSNVTLNDTDIDDPVNPASVAIVTPPATGTLTNNGDGTFNYDPTPNFFGSVSFTYTVTDPGLVTSNAAIVTITVGADNDAPNALDDNGAGFSTFADTLLTTPDVTVNDSDIDDPVNPASVAIVTPPATGTLTNNGDGTFDFDPAAGWTGTETFTYAITDPGLLTSNTASVSIDVSVAPVADPGGPYSIMEGDDLLLDGSASAGSPTSWNWDLDNDGLYDDASGVSPLVPWATLLALGIGDDGTYPIGLEIDGGADSNSTTLTIANVAPVLTTVGATNVTAGAPYTLNLAAIDPGDDLISTWTINWGDGTIDIIAGNPSSVTHTYTRVGFTFDILVSATDEDGTVLQNELLVPSFDGDTVFRFEATSGAFLQSFLATDDPIEAHIGPDGSLYVSSERTHSVRRYNAETGAFIEVFVDPASGGLDGAEGLASGPDGHLYVGNFSGNNILRFNGTTGAFIDIFATAGITRPYDIIFGPDSNLYVGNYTTSEIVRFDGATGAFIDVFVASGSGGLNTPEQMVFGPDGNLYVTSFNSGEILRFDGATGAFIDIFIAAGGPGDLDQPAGLAFGPDGELYVADHLDHAILRYKATTGAFLNEYVSAGSGGLTKPDPITFLAKTRVTINP